MIETFMLTLLASSRHIFVFMSNIIVNIYISDFINFKLHNSNASDFTVTQDFDQWQHVFPSLC